MTIRGEIDMRRGERRGIGISGRAGISNLLDYSEAAARRLYTIARIRGSSEGKGGCMEAERHGSYTHRRHRGEEGGGGATLTLHLTHNLAGTSQQLVRGLQGPACLGGEGTSKHP